MITLKCKSCGDIIPVNNKESFVVCPSCGNIYDVPMDDKKEQYLNLYSMADDAWDHKDFEEATELYQQILNKDNTQAEAHFGIVLCKYGITYEDDPFSKKKMPTCNRINRDSILDDVHYVSAIKYASKEAAASFKKRAEEIDRISRDYLKIVDKEPPYDVFISYKRTSEDGSVTQDSKVARKLYFHLKEKGFKIFFAEETLKSIGGEKYEPYIFAALSSAPVMILIGSKRDHFEAIWVKNEWRRYLVLMNQGLKKTLIPAYFDMDPYHMPGELRALQAMNATDFTFHEDITEIIRKKIADAKAIQESIEVKGQSLRDKYADKDKVNKLVDITDCDREFAINVLVQCHGDIKKSQQFIEEDPEYKKSLWVCVECNANNTHDKCHHCGTTKKESVEVARARKEMEERERKKSAEYKRKKAALAKKILVPFFVVVAIAILSVFVIWPKIIYPNLSNDDFNTPEIIRTYSGTYRSENVERDAIITISSCDESGNVKGFFEFFDDKIYGKYEISGKIVKKKNNGNLTLSISPGVWIIQPKNYNQLEVIEVEITRHYQSLKCSEYSMYWSSGENNEYAIKTADDLKKLVGSDETYQLRNDIEILTNNWSPIEGFTGTLIGNGFSIKNLNIDSSSSNVGLFSVLEGTIINMKIEDANVNVSGRNENIGILCGELKGTINNVSVSGCITADKSTNVGGVCGYVSTSGSYTIDSISNDACVTGLSNVGGCFGKVYDYISNGTKTYSVVFSNIKNSGEITAIEDYAGGVVAYIDAEASGFSGGVVTTIIDCENTGNISGNYYVAGIVGFADSDSNSFISSCTNASVITAKAVTGCIAGITGAYVITDSSNDGSTLNASGYLLDEGKKYAYVGGIVGKGACTENCTNYIDIVYSGGGDFVGGLMGYCNLGAAITGVSLASDTAEAYFKNLTNKGSISANSYVGGIIGGSLYYWSNGCTEVTATFEKIINSGNITAINEYAGGLVGYLACDVGGVGGGLSWCFYDSSNEASIYGFSKVGGLFGGFRNGIVGGLTSIRNTVTIEGCVSTGNVFGMSDYGDIIGFDDINK